jgi:signal transduction histidine kinase
VHIFVVKSARLQEELMIPLKSTPSSLVWNAAPYVRAWVESALVCLGLIVLLLIQVEWISGIAVRSGYLFAGLLAALWGGLRSRLPNGSLHRKILIEALLFLGYVTLLPAVIYFILGLFGLYPAVARYATGLWVWSEMMIIGIGALVFPLVRLILRGLMKWQRMQDRKLALAITQATLSVTLLVALLVILFFSVMIAAQTAAPIPEQIGAPVLVIALNRLVTIIFPTLTLFTGWALLALVVLTPLSAWFAYRVARRVTSRLEDLAGAAQQLAAGQLQARVPQSGHDEVALLQQRFNQMAEQLESNQKALEAERDKVTALLESRRQWFANISHELRTPVAVMEAYLDSAVRDQAEGSSTYATHDLAVLQDETGRLKRLLDDLFLLARTELDRLEMICQPVNLSPLLEQVIQAFTPYAWQTGGIKLIQEIAPDLPQVNVDTQRLAQILTNLLRNAVRHVRPGGIIGVFACQEETTVRIDVRDTGEGIQEADLTQIWDPFFQGKSSEKDNAGLGLALVKEWTERMGGTVCVASSFDQGTTFTVRFPIATQ